MTDRILDELFNKWEGDRLIANGVYSSTCPMLTPEQKNMSFPEGPLPSCFMVHLDGLGSPSCEYLGHMITVFNVKDTSVCLGVSCNK